MTKYFSKDTPLAGLERMMMSVPGFRERGGGMMVLCRFRYHSEDVDCRYCQEYAQRACQAPVCPYLPERLEAGVVGYPELVEECFRVVDHKSLRKRIHALSKGKTLPFVLETGHRCRLDEWMDVGTASSCPQKLAAIYLLTSSTGIWRLVHPCVTQSAIDFSSISLRGIEPQEYGLAYRKAGYEVTPHTRKGHYRTYKSGKTVYVKSSIIHKEKYEGIQSAHRLNQGEQESEVAEEQQVPDDGFTMGLSM